MCQIVTCLLPAPVVKCLVPPAGGTILEGCGFFRKSKGAGRGGDGGSGLLGLVLEAL